jgi:RNA polymerase sigma-70 factor, ECF subfamily
MTDWDTLVAQEGPTVWRILWKLLGNRSDVEECFQETFVTAVELSRRDAVTYWPAVLVRMATTRGMDRLRSRYRSRRRQQVLEAAVQAKTGGVASTDDPVALAIASELSERLREGLTQLPGQYSEIFILHALQGWSYRDIGDRMNMTETAIRTTIHRARQRLRELLDV